ncbi:MAG TPA: hypothetical protein PLF63_12905, partial [Rubrivivax sp.]|nr:hypothetical protein [Rubrivivax sp.]
VGRIARAVVTGSRFYGGYEGHLIKSRARETRLLYNLIVDGPDGEASYEVELPNGGVAHLIGNVIGGPDAVSHGEPPAPRAADRRASRPVA